MKKGYGSCIACDEQDIPSVISVCLEGIKMTLDEHGGKRDGPIQWSITYGPTTNDPMECKYYVSWKITIDQEEESRV